MATHWAQDAIFYHVYPLGFCGAPKYNNFDAAPEPRLEKLYTWMDHMQWLGVNALYLGPLFESTRHGYDTADYYRVDRRLGTNETLARLVEALHARGIRVILDGVFNHVGRDFWAFRDVQHHGEASAYRDWFAGLRFDGHSPKGDPFTYEGWNGYYSLVKLNLRNPDVREHLLGAVETWIREFDIDGLRLDAADAVDLGFQQELAAFGRRARPGFWLVGEIIHGDYRQWANPQTLDSVTNYECYKGLWSSHVDKNYFEIAYALNRQFGPGGMYRDLPLYAFADNHDVNRVASNLDNPAHLYPLYALLFTMPGVPSIYYGSEWGIEGRKLSSSDDALRPNLDLDQYVQHSPHPDLAGAVAKLARLRRDTPALRCGDYRQLHVGHEQFAFARQAGDACVVVAVNAAGKPAPLDLEVPVHGGELVDLLNGGERFAVNGGRLHIDAVPSCWARVLAVC
jgi:cyclomaltodextrinase / maltogenic alpha-amylase / neopullulanase